MRDQAAVLTLAAEASVAKAEVPRLIELVAKAYAARGYTSTQEQAWMLLAAHALGEEAKGLKLAVNGQPHQGQLVRAVSPQELQTGPFTIANTGDTPAGAVVSVVGAALTPEPAIAKGFTIERSYYTLDGKKVDLASATGGVSQLKQNERLIVVLKVDAQETGGRVLLVDRLPAGLEIENPRLVDSGDVKSLGWLKTTLAPQHTEFRDDRFVAAFDFFGSDGPGAARRRVPRSGVLRHGRLHRQGGDARLLCASRRDRGGHVQAGPLRPHVGRPARGPGPVGVTRWVRHSVPSPLAGEGQGGGESRTSKVREDPHP